MSFCITLTLPPASSTLDADEPFTSLGAGLLTSLGQHRPVDIWANGARGGRVDGRGIDEEPQFTQFGEIANDEDDVEHVLDDGRVGGR